MITIGGWAQVAWKSARFPMTAQDTDQALFDGSKLTGGTGVSPVGSTLFVDTNGRDAHATDPSNRAWRRRESVAQLIKHPASTLCSSVKLCGENPKADLAFSKSGP
jgi:hypothetical protein